MQAVRLVFEGTKEVLVPVKESSKQDNIEYMANLYSRCQETREWWLCNGPQPLPLLPWRAAPHC
jgi:hypothetical protein